MAEYPFYFEDFRKCIHCGGNNVRPIDKFNRPTNKNFIYPITKFRCMDCNREYYIKCVENSEGETVPVCCGESDVDRVVDNIIDISPRKRKNI
jgi:hypothetical protein